MVLLFNRKRKWLYLESKVGNSIKILPPAEYAGILTLGVNLRVKIFSIPAELISD